MNRSPQLQKNLLDLQYSTALQYFTTTVILLFTYIVGIVIALLTEQVDYTNNQQLSILFLITFAVVGLSVFFLQRFRSQLHGTLTQIEQLKL